MTRRSALGESSASWIVPAFLIDSDIVQIVSCGERPASCSGCARMFLIVAGSVSGWPVFA